MPSLHHAWPRGFTGIYCRTPGPRLLEDPQLLARLENAQMSYFEELVSGNYDAEYFEKRVRVGEIHNAVGLEPKW